MRIGAIVLLSLLIASAGAACCVVDRAGDPDWFFTDQHYFVKATASSPYELIVTQVFRGDIRVGAQIDLPRPSPIVVTSGDDCHPKPIAGHEYLVAGGSREWFKTDPRYTDWPPAPEFMKILNDRHVVTPADLHKQLRAWRGKRLSTKAFREWLFTAETNSAAFRDSHSLLVQAVRNAEFLAGWNETASRAAFAKSLEDIVRRLPPADTRPPLERDIGTRRDRYNVPYDQLQDWSVSARQQVARISG